MWLCSFTAACLRARQQPVGPRRAQATGQDLPPTNPCPAWRQHRKYVDDNPWKFDEDATAFAHELITTGWEQFSSTVDLAVLPLQGSLFADKPANGPTLVMRQCVRELWEEVFEQLKGASRTKVVIIGNSGIGKSRSLMYGLRLLLGGRRPDGAFGAPQDRVVIFECRKEGEVFAFVPPGQDVRGGEVSTEYAVYRIPLNRFTATECAALKNPENFYLIDPGRAEDGEPITVPAKTVKACSPDRRHYKEWAKEKSIQLYLSMWLLQELLEARQHIEDIDGNILPEEAVRERFQKVGGNPRLVFGSAEAIVQFLTIQSGQVERADMVRSVLKGQLPDYLFEPDSFPTYLFAYQSQRPFTNEHVSVVELSSGARDLIFKAEYAVLMEVLYRPERAKLRGFAFEDFVGWLLEHGACLKQGDKAKAKRRKHNSISLKCLRLGDVSNRWAQQEFQLDVQTGRVVKCDTVERLKEAWRGNWEKGLILKTPEDTVGLDYLLSPTLGVNATLDRQHEEPKPGLYQLLLEMNVKPENFQVIYFVPESIYNLFKPRRDKKSRATRLQMKQGNVQILKACVPSNPASL